MKKLFLSIISIVSMLSSAQAANQFLGVGGGYNPYHSQVALEKNLVLFSDLITQLHPENTEVSALFGSGPNSSALDVIEQISNFPIEDNLFSRLFDSCETPNCQLRHNTLGNLLNGAATKRNILDFMDLIKNKLTPTDKFRFYFTGHGSNANDNDFTKNYFATWDTKKISVQEFTEQLDKLPSETQTQVVMVQCYSGGFAQINYEGGEKNHSLSPSHRCGFFAQVPDRIAAGCTSDINKREEYSRYFWEAYRGSTEEGKSIQSDFNRDGKVTSDEAHAYVIIHENSIDIPTTTSSQLLREQGFSLSTALKRKTWNDIKDTLTPIEQVIVEGLKEKTGYDISTLELPLVFVEEQLAQLQKRKEISSQKGQTAQNLLDEVFVQIRNELSMIYPIFNNPYGANHGSIFIAQPQIFQSAKNAMLKHPEYEHFKELFLKRDEAIEEENQWERLETKWKRIQYLLETKLLEEQLATAPLESVKQKYQSLKECEAASFF